MKSDKQAIVQLQGISKNYGDQLAVDDINIDVERGEFFSLLGGSGSGKTTLLRLLAGFEQPTSGRIIIDNVDVTNKPPYARPVNMMFQSYALFPHMTVEANIAFGLKQERLPREEIKSRCQRALAMVELSHLAKRKPEQLSGGQSQRVALARCLAKRPKVILLDEPLSALDKNLREHMQFELVDIQETLGITFIMVTHDQAEAMTMSSRIAIMNNGSLEQIGTPTEVYEFPSNRFTANFIGKANMFECQVLTGDSDSTLLASDAAHCQFAIDHGIDAAENQTVWVAIRPEKMFISKTKPPELDQNNPVNSIVGTVEDIAYLGGISTYHIRSKSGHRIKAMDFNIERQSDHPTWEDTVYLWWDPCNIMVLKS